MVERPDPLEVIKPPVEGWWEIVIPDGTDVTVTVNDGLRVARLSEKPEVGRAGAGRYPGNPLIL